MGRLKSESFEKCVSLLRDFIDDSTTEGNKKRRAVLALEQLKKITAGDDVNQPGLPDLICTGRPRAFTS